MIIRDLDSQGKMKRTQESDTQFQDSSYVGQDFGEYMGVSEKGILFWGPYYKDPTIWGTILGSLCSETPI